LHYNRNRYYEPLDARFLTGDPARLAGGRNLYQYVRNPVGWVDPFGLAAKDCTDPVSGDDEPPKGRGNVDHAEDFDKARKQAFKNAGMTDPDKVEFSKYDEQTGTVVEFKGEKGAKVAYDGPHADMDPSKGHDQPHIGWQSGGKQPEGGTRGNITYEGPQHPSRSDKKE